MLYDEIMKIVTLAGELMLQAQDEELTVFDKAFIYMNRSLKYGN